MPCVVVPATALLVRGAAGVADPIAGVRAAVRATLAPELAAADRLAVLGTGPTWRSGRLRPTLAAAGIADAHVPALASLPEGTCWEGVAATGASVALLVLAQAGADIAGQVVDVVEVPVSAAPHEVDRAVARLRPSPSQPDERVLVVAADHPALGVDHVVRALTQDRPGRVTELAVAGEHLPGTYRITLWDCVG